MEFAILKWTRIREEFLRQMWGMPESQWLINRKLPLHILRLFLLTLENFRVNRLSAHASGLAFFMMMSLVPTLAFLFLILKIFNVAELVKPYLLDMVAGGNALIVEQISEYIENTKSAGLGGFGIITMFIIGFLVLQRVKITHNMIWQVEKWPSYRYRLIEYISILIVFPMLLAASFSLTTFLAGVNQMEAFRTWETLNGVTLALAGFSNHVVMWVVVFYAYAFLPDARIKLQGALLGAIVAGSLLKFLQQVYIVTIFQVTNYNVVYGALSLLPFLMIWFYLGWTIFLFGAQLSYVSQNYALILEKRRISGKMSTSAPYMALLTLAGLILEMQKSGKPARKKDYREFTGLPPGVIEDALARLVKAKLITPVQGDRGAFVPREMLEKITIREILDRLEILPEFSDPPPTWQKREGEVLQKIFTDANQALSKNLTGTTLKDLIKQMKKTGDKKK